MLFNSIDFAIFLPLVFLIYWFIGRNKVKRQNIILLIASYFFYSWWDWRFLSLILISTTVDYFVGIKLSNEDSIFKRKFLLFISIFFNIGLLGFFKYYNFFIDNLIQSFEFFGLTISPRSLNIILPVGISFYTFQTLSYTIDVYNKKIHPTKDFIAFAAFVSFFPQLVAGPIERAANLLGQFYSSRKFIYAQSVDGLRQILWGLFKKIVIADNCAVFVDEIFNNSDSLSGSTLVLGAVFFSFQIYGDFSGYSDIAIGTARLFGINLMKNFAFPYFSRDIAEFWRKWHISLTTWFRDYVYIPLGGSKMGLARTIINVFIIFIISGFWHGANWTFIVWGIFNAFLFLPLLITKKNRTNLDVVSKGKVLPTFKEMFGIVTTFILVTFGWIFFRAKSIDHALNYISTIFSKSIVDIPSLNISRYYMIQIIFLILFFLLIEWFGREHNFALEKLGLKWKPIFRLLFYFGLVFIIALYIGKEQQFIYFQF